MSLKTRREMEKLGRQEEILDAAERTFFRQSYQHTTMDDIARAADLSRALLYVYFKDKPAIMRGIMLRAAHALQSRFEEPLHLFQTGLEQIEGIGHAYHAFSRQQPDYFDVLTSVATFPHPDAEDEQMHALDAYRERINQIMVQALNNGIGDGTICPLRVPQPLQTAFYLQGALHGVIMQTRSPQPAQPHDADPHALILYTIAMLSLSIKTPNC